MAGLKPAVIGLIAAAAISVGQTVFFPNGWNTAAFSVSTFFVSLAIFLLITFLAFKKMHPILLICLSAVIGILTCYLLKLPVC